MTDIRNQIGDRRVTVESEEPGAEEDVDELVRSHVLREALIGTCLGCDRVVRGTRSDVTVLGLIKKFRNDQCSISLTHHREECVGATLFRTLSGDAFHPGYEQVVNRLIRSAWADADLINVLVDLAFTSVGDPASALPYLHRELPGKFLEESDVDV